MSVKRTNTYHQVLDRARSLDVQQQLDLIAELTATLRQTMVSQPQHSVMELQGLGKEIWQGIDTQSYVDQERDAWNG